MPGRRWLAFLGSFAVYLLPLVGPHAVWLLGESLLRELSGPSDRDPWWVAANVALALVAQAAVGLVLFWSFAGTRRRLLVIPLGAPLLWLALNTAYLITVPSWFLIEADDAPDRRARPERCAAAGVSLLGVRTPVGHAASGNHTWWVQGVDGRPLLFRAPACEVVDPKLPAPTVLPGGRADFLLGLQFALPRGAAVLERLEVGTSRRSWWLLSNPAMPLASIAEPESFEGAPILSNDGDAVAWLQQVAGSGPPVLERVIVSPVESDSRSTVIELTPFGPASYTLLSVDTRAQEVMLWRNDRPISVGFNGDRRTLSEPTGPIRPQASTYRRQGGGWLAWDAYKENGAYQLMWSLDAGAGQHRLAKGRSITSAAIDPTGTLIAVSATTTLSIGSAPDLVFVIRARDGADVFRAYIPRYSRSAVVFFDGGLFAYSDDRGTHLLEVSAAAD